jgi:hypothetical protein
MLRRERCSLRRPTTLGGLLQLLLSRGVMNAQCHGSAQELDNPHLTYL